MSAAVLIGVVYGVHRPILVCLCQMVTGGDIRESNIRTDGTIVRSELSREQIKLLKMLALCQGTLIHIEPSALVEEAVQVGLGDEASAADLH
jgi:hypothetical protein